MSEIVLYDCATAPSPRRARILLAEKGVRHATVQVDLAGRQQLEPAFLAVNPRGTVPVLRLEDGLTLTDNAAIAAYVEERWPQPPLMGTTPAERAEVASWQWRAEFDGLMAVFDAFRNASPAMAHRALPGPVDYEQIPALAQRSLLRVQHFFDVLEARLAQQASRGQAYLVGEAFSLADITALVTVDFARAVRLKPGEQHAQLQRWRSAVAQRPSMAL